MRNVNSASARLHRTKQLKYWIHLFVLALAFASCSRSEKDNDFPDTGGIISDTSSLNFFVLSDWGFNGSGTQKEVAGEMSLMARKVNLGFILTCGDNFQVAGVKSAADSLWKINFEDVYNGSQQVKWYPALGNHDYLGNPDAQVDYSAKSQTWTMPARFYSFVKQVNTTTFARFIVLDTYDLVTRFQQLDEGQTPEAIAQYSWVKNILAGAKEKWIFVTGHYPVYSSSNVHGDTPELKTLLRPLFEQYHVDFYICGHDHNFEHARENGEQTDYIVTGTGGWARPEGSNERTIFSLSAPGFTMVSLAADSATLRFVTADNHIGYSFVKRK